MADLEEPPMDSVEQVIKGLTKSQGWAIRNGDAAGISYAATPMTRCKLQEKGIVVNRQYATAFTDFGLEVRARLLSSGGEG